jgi:beta-glucosidase
MKQDPPHRRWISTHRRLIPFAAGGAAIVLVTSLSASAAVTRAPAQASAGRPAYLNAGMPAAARAADLLGRMTLPEKIGQMDQIEATEVTDTSKNCNSQGGFNMPNPV